MKKKRFAGIAAGLGLAAALVPVGGTAYAAECAGSPDLPDTFVCIIRTGSAPTIDPNGPIVNLPRVCAPLVGCTQGTSVQLPTLDAPDEIIVVYYQGKCYYVTNGGNIVSVKNATSIDPPACP